MRNYNKNKYPYDYFIIDGGIINVDDEVINAIHATDKRQDDELSDIKKTDNEQQALLEALKSNSSQVNNNVINDIKVDVKDLQNKVVSQDVKITNNNNSITKLQSDYELVTKNINRLAEKTDTNVTNISEVKATATNNKKDIVILKESNQVIINEAANNHTAMLGYLMKIAVAIPVTKKEFNSFAAGDKNDISYFVVDDTRTVGEDTYRGVLYIFNEEGTKLEESVYSYESMQWISVIK